MLVPFQSTANVDRLLSRVYAGVISFFGGEHFLEDMFTYAKNTTIHTKTQFHMSHDFLLPYEICKKMHSYKTHVILKTGERLLQPFLLAAKNQKILDGQLIQSSVYANILQVCFAFAH